jgi:hypothetical protein
MKQTVIDSARSRFMDSMRLGLDCPEVAILSAAEAVSPGEPRIR